MSAQQVKDILKLIEHLRASMNIINSVHHKLWKKNLPHFSLLHTDSFALPSL